MTTHYQLHSLGKKEAIVYWPNVITANAFGYLVEWHFNIGKMLHMSLRELYISNFFVKLLTGVYVRETTLAYLLWAGQLQGHLPWNRKQYMHRGHYHSCIKLLQNIFRDFLAISTDTIKLRAHPCSWLNFHKIRITTVTTCTNPININNATSPGTTVKIVAKITL